VSRPYVSQSVGATAADAQAVGTPTFSVVTLVNPATATIDLANYDTCKITGLAQAVVIANPVGTPVSEDLLELIISDNGTARAIAFGTLFAAEVSLLPTTTVAGKRMRLVFQFNSDTGKYGCLAVLNQL